MSVRTNSTRRRVSPRRLVAGGSGPAKNNRDKRRWGRHLSRATLAFGAFAGLLLMALSYEQETQISPAQLIALQPAPPVNIAPPVRNSVALTVLESPQAESQPEPAWRQFAAVAEALPGQPRIAIIIDDMGIDPRRSRRVIDLPGTLTTSFLPYGPHTVELSALARASGHELMLHLPMEPNGDDVDPGPHALLTGMSGEDVLKQLTWNLERFDGYVGVNNHMGSAFTRNTEGMRAVLHELDRRELLFIDSMTTGVTATDSARRGLALPVMKRDVFLDNVREERAIWLQLKTLEEQALRTGYAIAIGHPYDETVRALKAWIPRARDRGFALVPVSALVEEASASRLAAAKPEPKRLSDAWVPVVDTN